MQITFGLGGLGLGIGLGEAEVGVEGEGVNEGCVPITSKSPAALTSKPPAALRSIANSSICVNCRSCRVRVWGKVVRARVRF